MTSKKAGLVKNEMLGNEELEKDETRDQGQAGASDQGPPDGILTSQQEVADELKMSVQQFMRRLRKYPFNTSGVSGKVLGRWHVTRGDVWRWFHYVQRQEARHPDARRMRPEEAPEIAAIRGR